MGSAALRHYDPAGRCPKCGSDAVTSEWIAATDTAAWRKEAEEAKAIWERGKVAALRTPRDLGCPAFPDEHIDRKCPRCLFKWSERPLDSIPLRLGSHPGGKANAASSGTEPFQGKTDAT